MKRQAYDALTSALTAWASNEPSVIGLVAVGSTGGVLREPDEWSDHDVLVITVDGAAGRLLDDLTWLPDANRISVRFIETDRGRSFIYDDGHLIELAVIDQSNLDDLPLNTYRVLVDRDRIEERLAIITQQTARQVRAEDAEGTTRYQRFVKELVIGLGRYGRGETLSASQRIRGTAMTNLLSLIGDFLPPEQAQTQDNLDPHRRFELAHPTYAARPRQALELPIPELADEMLRMAEQTLAGRVSAATPESIDAVRAVWARVSEWTPSTTHRLT